MKKQRVLFVMIIFVITILASVILINSKRDKYSVDALVDSYDLLDSEVENKYLNYLKTYIQPIKLRGFIDNNYVPTSLIGGKDTGKEMIELMKEIGYDILFNSLFDKERKSFDDCPITDNFRQKFNTNLLEYFNLVESEDCKSMCSLYMEDKEIIVEVYGNFKNTEPTYWTTHHFHYALDEEGNVDDVIFDYVERKG